jgi:endonuclease/exonuclease/phosphatase (EEP) superfamily protein YafD
MPLAAAPQRWGAIGSRARAGGSDYLGPMQPDPPPAEPTVAAAPARPEPALVRWPWVALGALVAVTLLGVTVRDRLPLLSTLVYAAPLPVVAAASGALAALARRRQLMRPALAGLALSAALLGAHLVRDLHLATPVAARAGSIRLVLWNVSRGAFGWDDVLRDLRACDADVIALVEARSATPENGAALRAALPGYEVFLVEGGMALAVRGHLPGVVRHDLDGGGRALAATVEPHRLAFTHPRVDLLLADVKADPLRDRGPAFAALERLRALRAGRPLVIFGDFNTPTGSVHLDRWRDAGLREAFDVSGRGLASTWPAPCPVLTLDHVWVAGLRPLAARHVSTLHSDHRRVEVELELE